MSDPLDKGPDTDARLDVLMVEDDEADALLVERALQAGRLECNFRRVESRQGFQQALAARVPDIILADYNLPEFDGAEALRLAREIAPHTPLIIVTGAMLDEAAVALLREGAADYLLKDRLSRLAPAVMQALAAAESARRHAADVTALRSSERRYRGLFECALDGIAVVDAERGTLVDANPSLEALLGFESGKILGRRLAELVAAPDRAALEASLAGLEAGGSFRLEPLRLTGKGGAPVEVEFIANAYEVDEGRFVRCNVRDIGERLAAQRRMNEQLEELRQFQRLTVDRELHMQELEVELARIRDGPH